MTPKRIWEMLRDGKDVEKLIDGLPDEFHDEVMETVQNFREEYQKTLTRIYITFDMIADDIELETADRKTAALRIQEEPKIRWGCLFMLLDGKDIETKVWDLVKPDRKSVEYF
jgi:hypothetical protein